MLIQSLSLAGVFKPAKYPTFFDGYVPPDERVLPPVRFPDWFYPTIWWRAQDGVDARAVKFWFPELELDRVH